MDHSRTSDDTVVGGDALSAFDEAYRDEVRMLMSRAGSLSWGTASGRLLLPRPSRGSRPRRRAA